MGTGRNAFISLPNGSNVWFMYVQFELSKKAILKEVYRESNLHFCKLQIPTDQSH